MTHLAACGKKGPPFLPELRLDARLDLLTGTWVDGAVRLEGIIQGADKGADITGGTIYYAWYPEDQPPCEGCPIEMTRFPGPVDTMVTGDRVVSTMSVSERDGISFWEVRLTDGRGAVGPPSERLRLKMGK
jgi:hypothetical protein